MSHKPFREYFDADALHQLLLLPKHEIRSLIEEDQDHEVSDFSPFRTTRGGGYSSLSVFIEAL